MERSNPLWRYDLRACKDTVINNRAELTLRVVALNVTAVIAAFFFQDLAYIAILAFYNVVQIGLVFLLKRMPDRATFGQTVAVFGVVALIIGAIMAGAIYLWAMEGTEGKVLALLLVAAAMLYTASSLRFERVLTRVECGGVAITVLVLIGLTLVQSDMRTPALSMVIGLVALLAYFLLAAWSTIHTQEQLAASQAAEVHRARMEAIGQLAGGVVHDFNNLLAIIKGNLELRRTIQLQGGSLLEAEQLIREVEDATMRAERTAQHLLAFSRRSETPRVRFRLADVLEETLPLLRACLPANIALRAELGAGIKAVRGDPSQFENVVLNLVINACDATLAGGEIWLRVSEEERNVVLEVSDSGVGMAQEVQDRVMEPFFTTKPQGSGLGLSMARTFADQAGGGIQIDSVPGEGTRVRLSLPVDKPLASPAAQDMSQGVG